MDTLDKSSAHQLKAEQAFEKIIEIMEQSVELSIKLGEHPLDSRCACMACITMKKRLLRERTPESQFFL